MITPHVSVKITENLPSGPRLRQALGLGLRDGLELIKNRAERQWSLEAPRSKEGSGLTVEVEAGAGAIKAVIGTPRFEARFLESGTTPHTIIAKKLGGRSRRWLRKEIARRQGLKRLGIERPRLARALAIGIGGRGVIFRRKVRHPGQRPAFWLSRSVDAGLPDARAAIEARLREAFRG